MTLYRKYRPQNFSDLIGQDHIRDTLMQAVKEGKLSQAYLFTGPRGTGKTTTARLIARVANCLDIEEKRRAGKEVSGEPCGKCANCLEIADGKSLDIIEIDAASNRSIDDIRELREQVRFAPAKSKFKVYIIDEVHMLTREAFNALLKTLEEPPSHAIFILATTEPHKVLPTIISRTQRFDFRRIAPDALAKHLGKISEMEGLKSESEALEMIAALADGGSRDSLSLLEQVAAYSNDVTAENVRSILGIVEIGQIISLLRAIFNSDAEEGLKIAHSLFEEGMNMSQLNASIVDVLRKLLTYDITGTFLIAETEENKSKIIKLQKDLLAKYAGKSQLKLLAVIKNFIDAGKMMKETVDPLVAVEVAVVESVDFPQSPKSEILNPKQNDDHNDPKDGSKEINQVSKQAEVAQTAKEAKVTEKPRLAEAKKTGNTEAIPEETVKTEPKTQSERAETAEEKPRDDAADSVEKGKARKSGKPLSELPSEVWENVIMEVKKENTSLAALLRDAKPMALESGKLVLGVRFKFHKDKISEAKNVMVLEGVICDVTGSSCQVMCEIADFSAKKTKESHSDDELASEAERVFSE